MLSSGRSTGSLKEPVILSHWNGATECGLHLATSELITDLITTDLTLVRHIPQGGTYCNQQRPTRARQVVTCSIVAYLSQVVPALAYLCSVSPRHGASFR
jgi:hypothetical protein